MSFSKRCPPPCRTTEYATKARMMSNTLQVSMIETVKQLDSIGWSQRKIASELGVHRKTVRTYLQADSKCTISTDGSLKDGEQKSGPSKVGRQSFIRSIENACRSFGCVPERLVVDNLKAGVFKACVYDPDLNPKLCDFAAHYGTICRQVEQMFMEEKPFLRPLPLDLFPAYQEGRRKVHRDGHIEVAKAYYSVSPEYNQREVWVRYDGRLVEVFSDKMEKITAHAQKEPGQRSSRQEHIPAEKISNPERGNEWMLQKAWVMGNAARAWAGAMLKKRGQPGTRVLNGLLSLIRGRLLGKYLKPDLLIIDDMGLKQLPSRAGEHLFEVIMRRYELRSTLMAGNRPIEDWGQLIGDVPLSEPSWVDFYKVQKSSRSRDRQSPSDDKTPQPLTKIHSDESLHYQGFRMGRLDF